MTKKLFVVLVVVLAMLISLSLVMAKMSAVKGPARTFEKQAFTQRESAIQLPPKPPLTAPLAVTRVDDVVSEIVTGPSTKHACDLDPGFTTALTGFFVAGSEYANFQDPAAAGCTTNVYPYDVQLVVFHAQVTTATFPCTVKAYFKIYDEDIITNPACPQPGTLLFTSTLRNLVFPSAGHWVFYYNLPFASPPTLCVNRPYFVSAQITYVKAGATVDAVTNSDGLTCHSYRAQPTGSGWVDIVPGLAPGQFDFFTRGLTDPQNDCLPDTACILRNDAGLAYSITLGTPLGKGYANYFDPARCGTGAYPFGIDQVVFMQLFGTGSGWPIQVRVRFFAAGADSCTGPGPEIYSEVFTIPFNETRLYLAKTLAHPVCVNGPFYVGVFCEDGSSEFRPCLSASAPAADSCRAWYWDGTAWYNWKAVQTGFGIAIGYPVIRAKGIKDHRWCPVTCDMEQDNGNLTGLGGFWAAGYKAAKYFDPEEWCTPPVYPYRLKSVSFAMYDYYSVGSGDYQVGIYIKCQEICDGPGTKIYTSPIQTFNAGFPDWYTIDLPDPVCVYEPFYVALECLAPSTHAPQLLFDDQVPRDTCHYWFWRPTSTAWIENYNFWTSPATIGEDFIYVTGFTDDYDCNPPPCDTALTKLAGGGGTPVYYWAQPDNYGDNFFNERFEMPADRGGTLEKFDISFYAAGSSGTPNPDFYVWLSDGTFPDDNNPPYQAIADFHINNGAIVWYPGATTVQTYSHLIHFDASELFHIGYSHAQAVGDVLSVLSTGNVGSNRSSEYWGLWGTMQSDWGLGVNFFINAYICPGLILAPFFTMKCTPALGYASPGDAGVNVYKIELLPVLGYNLPVNLSLLSVNPPDPGITAAFSPTNPQTLPDTVDVAMSVGSLVPYGNYTLTFQGVGSDLQTKTSSVTLTVRYPYDERIVNFHHGWQRTSNFGPVANGDLPYAQNWSWYGKSFLFDGSIVSVTPVAPLEDHMAMDVFSCEHTGFIPTQHMVMSTPWFGEMAYSNFYTDTLQDVIFGEFDSFYVVGLSNVVSTDFSIKIKIYYNPTTHLIPVLYPAIIEDWDINGTGGDLAGMDTLHNLIYQWGSGSPDSVYGIMRVPTDDNLCQSIVSIWNILEVYPVSQGGDSSFNCGVAGAPGPAYLARLIMNHQYRPTGFWGEGADDHSVLISSKPFSLNPGEKHIEVWFDFGRNLNDGLTWEMWYKYRLRLAGFYRGDVNANDSLEAPLIDISDLVYLINYQFKDGPPPLPFADQGDVNADRIVDLADVVYLTKFAYRGGTAPIDYLRFIPSLWTRTSLFTSPNWK